MFLKMNHLYLPFVFQAPSDWRADVPAPNNKSSGMFKIGSKDGVLLSKLEWISSFGVFEVMLSTVGFDLGSVD